MKKAAKALGITGGITGFLISVYAIVSGFIILSVDYSSTDFESAFGFISSFYGGMLLICGFICAACSIMGFAGSLIVRRHRIASGVLMLSGCLICFITLAFLAAVPLMFLVLLLVIIMLLLGGIFALIPEKQQPAYPYPPYAYPYPPYPQYPQQPQPYQQPQPLRDAPPDGNRQ